MCKSNLGSISPSSRVKKEDFVETTAKATNRTLSTPRDKVFLPVSVPAISNGFFATRVGEITHQPLTVPNETSQ